MILKRKNGELIFPSAYGFTLKIAEYNEFYGSIKVSQFVGSVGKSDLGIKKKLNNFFVKNNYQLQCGELYFVKDSIDHGNVAWFVGANIIGNSSHMVHFKLKHL